jgi:hypothetical protein
MIGPFQARRVSPPARAMAGAVEPDCLGLRKSIGKAGIAPRLPLMTVAAIEPCRKLVEPAPRSRTGFVLGTGLSVPLVDTARRDDYVAEFPFDEAPTAHIRQPIVNGRTVLVPRMVQR